MDADHIQRSENMGIGIMNSGFLFDNSSSSSSGMNNYSWLSEYNNIRSGTYYKVLKAYYANNCIKTVKKTIACMICCLK